MKLFKRNPRIAAGLLLAFLLFHASSAFAEEVRVAVASNFLLPLKELAREFEKSTRDKVIIISGSTGKLFAQIKQGAPFDVFLAADSARPEILEKENLGVRGSRFTYAVGRLALWSVGYKKSALKNLQVLKGQSFRYLAIANPKTAPYGKATEQVLRKEGFWGQLQTKLVRGENISQTLQFVFSRNADLGFVSLSQLKGNQVKLKGNFWVIPEDWHDPIRQQAILLKRAQNNKAALEFLHFLENKRAQKIIESYGYSLKH